MTMNRREESTILLEQSRRLQAIPFPELKRLLGGVVIEQITGPSGRNYNLEVLARWQDRTQTTLRVRCLIDGGGLQTLFPLTIDFTIAP
jgi:hypothetical protein